MPDLPALAITPVPSDEAERLAELERSTFVETFGHLNEPDELERHVARAFAVDHIARQLADERIELSWVLEGEHPVAFLKLNHGDAQTEPDLTDGLEVEQVYVRATHQGLGLGRLLLEHATVRARAEGLAFVWLGVWEENAKGIAVYERLGYRAFGEHTFLLGTDPQRDVLMRLDIA
jgi:ribosomal protein S18 acetylase RimI-like enzyme